MNSRRFLVLAPLSMPADRSRLLPTLAFVFAMLTVNSALADQGQVKITSISSSIEVESDGHQYTEIDGPNTEIDAEMYTWISAGTIGKIKSWHAWPKLLSPTHWTEFKDDGVAVTYPSGSNVKSVSRYDSVSIDVKYYAVEECNAMAQRLRNNLGYSDEEIFAVDRVVTLWAHAGVEWDSTFSAGENDILGFVNLKYPTAEILCKAVYTPSPQAADDVVTKQYAKLAYVTLDMWHDKQPTECPAEVAAVVTYVAETQGSFKSRFRSVFGQVSKEFELSMGPEDKRGDVYLKSYIQKFLVGVKSDPEDPNPGTPPTGGFGMDKIINVDDPNDGFPTDPDSRLEGADSFSAKPTKPNVNQDSLWIEVTSAAPNSIDRSDYAGYKVTCETNYDPVFDGPDAKIPVPNPTQSNPRNNLVVEYGLYQTNR